MDTSSTSTFSESTKTSSSGDSRAEEEDDKFKKDNVASPIDMEGFIQTERIMKLLDRAVYKTKLSLCLPLLMHDTETVMRILMPQDYYEVSFIFDQYDNPMFSNSLINIEALEEIEAGEVTFKHRLNPELAHLLYVMNSYDALQPIVEETVNIMRRISGKHYRHVPQGLMFLMELEKFRELMKTRLETTAAEELYATFQTRKLEASNEKLVKRIAEYSTKLKEETEKFEADMLERENTKDKLENERQQLRESTTFRLNQIILDSERQMVLLSRTHLVKKDMLKEVQQETREAYDRLLTKDLIDEKTLRQRRRKVETQLQSWVQKYDLEMKEKQIELDEFIKKCDDEKRMIEDLERKLAEQNKEFEPLMKEREDEYHAEMTEKLNNFIMEHAARVIQYAWRETLANRAEKKRLKKILQKQKQMAEAAARAAEAAEKKAAAAAKKAAKEAKKQEKAEKMAAKEAAKQSEKLAK